MKKYIQFLLKDLENAKSIIPPKPNYKLLYPDHPAFQFGLDYIVEWEMSPQIPMEEIFRIDADQFPVCESITSEQMKLIIDAIISLWEAHRIDAYIPENIPIEIIYKVIINKWRKPFAYVSEGFMGIEFCSYDPDECPFGNQYCTCKDIEVEDMEHDLNGELDDSIPIDMKSN